MCGGEDALVHGDPRCYMNDKYRRQCLFQRDGGEVHDENIALLNSYVNQVKIFNLFKTFAETSGLGMDKHKIG